MANKEKIQEEKQAKQEITIFPTGDAKEVTLANQKKLTSLVKKIHAEYGKVENSFLAIAHSLYIIYANRLYEISGCQNIYEYAEKEFNIARGTCNNYISIVKQFCAVDNKEIPLCKLADQYKGFKASQLIIMLSIIGTDLIAEITPDMSTRVIKQKIKEEMFPDALPENKKKSLPAQKKPIEGSYKEVETPLDTAAPKATVKIATVENMEDFKKKTDSIYEAIEKSLKKGYRIQIIEYR